VKRCEVVAGDLALLYAGEPDEKVASPLSAMRANLEAELSNKTKPG
jgi:hypothetical protein